MSTDLFVIFTTEEGGIYKTRRASLAEYEQAAASGYWVGIDPVTEKVTKHKLAYIASAYVYSDHDFVLGHSRRDVTHEL